MSHTRSRRRIAVTGIGVVCAAGETVPELWASLMAGRSAIKPLEKFYQNHPNVLQRSAIKDYDLVTGLAAQVDAFDQRRRLQHVKRDKLLQLADRFSLFASAAADEAMRQAGLCFPLAEPRRAACIIGSAEAGVINVEAAYRHIFELKNPASHPMTLLRIIGSSAAAHVGIEYGIKGPVYGVCGDSASGAQAIETGAGYIRSGLVDMALVGGSDAPHTFGTMRMWEAAGLLSADGLFPFADTRNGTVLGEGAGVLILEELEHARRRGATILAELCGTSLTATATDMMTQDCDSIVATMRQCLADAGIEPREIDYLNADGSGIASADGMEADAINATFADAAARLPVSATKGAYGNPLGAAPVIEAAICIRAIAAGWIPPTVGVAHADPGLRLDVVTSGGRNLPVRHAMSTTCGHMGLNAAMIFGPPPA